jgi:hypothetical protein
MRDTIKGFLEVNKRQKNFIVFVCYMPHYYFKGDYIINEETIGDEPVLIGKYQILKKGLETIV